MSRSRKGSTPGAMLELWRPPQNAGDPIGCLTTTYTFNPTVFEEQCLARFMDIESEPSREDLAYVIERESRLGSIYAGVLADHSQAGVVHSLRWDVLPVRIRGGKQHSKVTLLVWNRHIRVVVASANLTEPGYRYNQEVTGTVDIKPADSDPEFLAEVIRFLRALISVVPGAVDTVKPRAIERAIAFLDETERLTRDWAPRGRRGTMRQHFVCTLPSIGGQAERSTLSEAINACSRRGRAPHTVWIASPFFDMNDESAMVASTLCKSMGRGLTRDLLLCVPAAATGESVNTARLAAPKAIFERPKQYGVSVSVGILPDKDGEKNQRIWHAKMLLLAADDYAALMVGSSNFTCAGMGIGRNRNAEGNLITLADRVSYGRESGNLEAIWPEFTKVEDPASAEWLGSAADPEEEGLAAMLPAPEGFLSATYQAGDTKKILLSVDPANLPIDWQVSACTDVRQIMLNANKWEADGRPPLIELPWDRDTVPERLVVEWDGHEAYLPINVEDSSALPPPALLSSMSVEDLLRIWSSVDPGAAFRVWARQQQPTDLFDSDLDAVTPVELDPLRMYNLATTFLHRVRHRARVLAQLRTNLQRPVSGQQALEWRLRGLVGIELLADRLLKEFLAAGENAGEALLSLADFLIVLSEVEYTPTEGALSKSEFGRVYWPFLRELAGRLNTQSQERRLQVSTELNEFWGRVIEQCQS
jgi:hypothetical protein